MIPPPLDYRAPEPRTLRAGVRWTRVAAAGGLVAAFVAWGKAASAEGGAYAGERELAGFLIAFSGLMILAQINAIVAGTRRSVGVMAFAFTSIATLALAVAAGIAIYNGR